MYFLNQIINILWLNSFSQCSERYSLHLADLVSDCFSFDKQSQVKLGQTVSSQVLEIQSSPVNVSSFVRTSEELIIQVNYVKCSTFQWKCISLSELSMFFDCIHSLNKARDALYIYQTWFQIVSLLQAKSSQVGSNWVKSSLGDSVKSSQHINFSQIKWRINHSSELC